MENTFAAITSDLRSVLLDMGIEFSAIDSSAPIERSYRGVSYKKSIVVQRQKMPVQLMIYAKDKKNFEVSTKHHYRYTWHWGIQVAIENRRELNLTLSKETLGQRIKKHLFKFDLEVYNPAFDKLFWIESSSTYAHALLLQEAEQNALVALEDGFENLTIKGNSLNYTEEMEVRADFKKKAKRERLKAFWDLCLGLGLRLDQMVLP